MKNSRTNLDLGEIFDDIFDAAQGFREEFRRSFGNEPFAKYCFDENTDYYPNYSYPPMNIYMGADRSLTFEFALAGFEEKNIDLVFQGDYMVFSAKIGGTAGEADSLTGGAHGQDGGAGGALRGSGVPGFGAPGFGNGGADYGEAGQEDRRYFKRRLKFKDIERQKYYVPLDKYAQEKVKAVFKDGILRVTVPPKDEPDQSDGIRIEIVKEGH
ncbi:MAG: Hsp20 family protein [Treponema sp.]|nr:Hsp20 family protein [Treponema sp.]